MRMRATGRSWSAAARRRSASAAALVESGIWFECEATAGGQWRFSVALGAYARLCTLNATLGVEAAVPNDA